MCNNSRGNEIINNFGWKHQSNDRLASVLLRMNTNKESSFISRGISSTGSYLDNLSSSPTKAIPLGESSSHSIISAEKKTVSTDNRAFMESYLDSLPSNADNVSPIDNRVYESSSSVKQHSNQGSRIPVSSPYLGNSPSASVSGQTSSVGKSVSVLGSYLDNISSDATSARYISENDASGARQSSGLGGMGSYLDNLSSYPASTSTVRNGISQSSADDVRPPATAPGSITAMGSYLDNLSSSSTSESSVVKQLDTSGSDRSVSVTESYLDNLSIKYDSARRFDNSLSAAVSYLDSLSYSATSVNSAGKIFSKMTTPTGTYMANSYLNNLTLNISRTEPVGTVSATAERSATGAQSGTYILQLVLTSAISLGIGLGVPIQFLNKINPVSIPFDSIQARVKAIINTDLRVSDPTSFTTETEELESTLDSEDYSVDVEPDVMAPEEDTVLDFTREPDLKDLAPTEAIESKDLTATGESEGATIKTETEDLAGINVGPADNTNLEDLAKASEPNDLIPVAESTGSSINSKPEDLAGASTNPVVDTEPAELPPKVAETEAAKPNDLTPEADRKGSRMNSKPEDLASTSVSKDSNIIPRAEDLNMNTKFYKKLAPPDAAVESANVPLSNLLSKDDNIIPSSYSSPDGEDVRKAIDGLSSTKYLNFKKLNTGFTVTPSTGPSIISAISITTANDSPERDPVSWQIFGSNNGVDFTEIAQGSIKATKERFHTETMAFSNAKSFTSYKIVFPSVADPLVANSMQVAEVSLIGKPLR
jgi:hypothetical protein